MSKRKECYCCKKEVDIIDGKEIIWAENRGPIKERFICSNCQKDGNKYFKVALGIIAFSIVCFYLAMK